MEQKLTFNELYEAYQVCFKTKKKKVGTYTFVNDTLCQNLMQLLEELNNRTYYTKPSNCYVITEPALREIYAAQFSDRIVQHLYMKEIEDILESKLVDGCCSCRKNRGCDYALHLLRQYLVKTSEKGTKDCFFLKIDLSGYFMSIDRQQICNKFSTLIQEEYTGKHKELLLYLTPIIFKNNPSLHCIYKGSEGVRKMVPNRRKMNPESDYGMAIGNLTAQAGSNLNLSNFDTYVIKELALPNYIRYVDDIIIISDSKQKLVTALPKIISKLQETHQDINNKKTKIDTAYHGVSFLGKVSYPYGYQRAKRETIIRTYERARQIEYTDVNNLLAKANSQIGTLKNFNCKKVIRNYVQILQNKVQETIYFDENKWKFAKKK